MSKKIIALILSIVLVLSFSIVLASAETATVATETEFLNAIGAGKSIKLSADVILNNNIVLSDGDKIIIDLNGNDITYNGESHNYLFGIPANTSLTITDSQNAGKVSADVYCFYASGGSLTISGGQYKSCEIIYAKDYSTITINDGIFEGNNETYESFIAESFDTTWTINGGKFTDFDYGMYTNSSDITIKDIDATAANYCIYFNKDENSNHSTSLKIDGGKLASNYNTMIVYGGTLTINGGTFSSSECNALDISDGAIATINGGTFETTATLSDECWFCAVNNYATLTINGGTFKSSGGPAVRLEGNATITDGYFSGKPFGVYLENYGISADFPDKLAYEYKISGGHFCGNAITKEEAKELNNDDQYEGTTAGIFAVRQKVENAIVDGYCIYTNNKVLSESKLLKIYEDESTFTNNYYTDAEVAVEKTKASILDGKDAKIDASKATDTLFKSDINYRWFENGEVKVDGKTVDSSNYTSAPGSTDITLKASYLKTLSNGKHTLQIVSNILDNKLVAETTFTVTNAPVEETKETTEIEEVADTADNSMIGAFVALGMFSALGYTALKKKEN